MDLVGQVVTHKAFGEGIVCQQDEGHVSVEFAQGTKRFVYPDAFARFLVLGDGPLKDEVDRDLALRFPPQAAPAPARPRPAVSTSSVREPPTARPIAVVGDAAGASGSSARGGAPSPVGTRPATKAAASKPAAKPPSKPATRPASKTTANSQRSRTSRTAVTTIRTTAASRTTTRVAGRPVAFLAYQAATLGARADLGYLWAPTQARDGATERSWDLLLDVRPGDIVLFVVEGQVRAVGRAIGTSFETSDLDGGRALKRPGVMGRRVDCSSTVLASPVETLSFLDDILELGCGEHGPYDEHGNERDGYLYELEPRLARSMLDGIAQANPTLARQGFVQRYLSGE